jgi:hypothetical protein
MELWERDAIEREEWIKAMASYRGKRYAHRVPQYDPPGLEKAWQDKAEETLGETKPSRAMLKTCLIALRTYSKRTAGKSRHLRGRLASALGITQLEEWDKKN